ncbi:MAG: TIGR03936 family radical SAM-associated protein [Planctomycetota bacterium]|jgi:radical SAM-linked protein
MLVVVKFRIRGNLRFLSHAETLKVFQRACVRAGVKLEYSYGYNPHPRLSLPLPRSVGVEADDDLLCLRVKTELLDSPSCPSTVSFDAEAFRARLSEQLPHGCELIAVALAQPGASLQPCLATYVFTLARPDSPPEWRSEKLKAGIQHLLASEHLNIQRRRAEKADIKDIDVRPFLMSIDLNDRHIIVECKVTSAGSVRVDEILTLLDLDVEMLAAPIRRTSVKWKEKTGNWPPNWS